MQNKPMLCVQDLSVRFKTKYGSAAAVNHVSFSLKKGEKLGLVGESGSGKSVTSKSIIRLLPTPPAQITGSIRLNGEELLTKTERQMCRVRGNQISMIFQEPMVSLDPLFPIGDQLGEVVRLHKKVSQAQANEMSIEMLRTVGIPSPETRLKQYPFELSGGMRQRVMIAMGLICHPKLLIADEPTTALDVTIQAQILELMKELQKKTHMGIIFITHNLGVVAEICDKVSVMYAGKIVEQGPVDDIFYKPGHPYTVGLLRSMPRVDAESYERLIPIEGTPVDMLNPPEGCPFAPRCEHAMKICLQKMPPYVELGEGHRSACWLRVQDQLDKAGQEKPVQDQEVSGRE